MLLLYSYVISPLHEWVSRSSSPAGYLQTQKEGPIRGSMTSQINIDCRHYCSERELWISPLSGYQWPPGKQLKSSSTDHSLDHKLLNNRKKSYSHEQTYCKCKKENFHWEFFCEFSIKEHFVGETFHSSSKCTSCDPVRYLTVTVILLIKVATESKGPRRNNRVCLPPPTGVPGVSPAAVTAANNCVLLQGDAPSEDGPQTSKRQVQRLQCLWTAQHRLLFNWPWSCQSCQPF